MKLTKTFAQILDFVREVLTTRKFDGTWYLYISRSYALVFAYDDEGLLNCKLAYNCDDLQCDYDVDWNMPDTDGEVFDTEFTDCLNPGIPEVIVDYYLSDVVPYVEEREDD